MGRMQMYLDNAQTEVCRLTNEFKQHMDAATRREEKLQNAHAELAELARKTQPIDIESTTTKEENFDTLIEDIWIRKDPVVPSHLVSILSQCSC